MALLQKLPEVPLLPERTILDKEGKPHKVILGGSELRQFLSEVRKSIEQLRGQTSSPGLPSNLKVTPQAFGNLIQWSRGTGADFHEVLWNTTPTTLNANVVPVQNAAQWNDNVGQVGVKRWYWVRAVKQTALHAVTRTIELGPIAGTTLASGAGVAPPSPPAPGVNQALNERTGGREPL